MDERKEDFEAPFLETTRLFYRAESQNFIAKNTCPDYMLKVRRLSFPPHPISFHAMHRLPPLPLVGVCVPRHRMPAIPRESETTDCCRHDTSTTSFLGQNQKAEARLQEEQKRVADYLNASTEPKLRAIVEEELVKAHAPTLIEVRGLTTTTATCPVESKARASTHPLRSQGIFSTTLPATLTPHQMENSGCKVMLRDDKLEDLRRMYVFAYTHTHTYISRSFVLSLHRSFAPQPSDSLTIPLTCVCV